jgi:serine/threonine protein kinase
VKNSSEIGSESRVSARVRSESFERIGRYEILSELGRGAVGRVFLARDPNIDRKVALKVFAPREPLDSDQQGDLHRRFVLEAQAAGRLRHPGIVTIYDAESDLEVGHSFIAMEYVDGRSLKDWLDSSGPLSPDDALPVIGQVALALDAAHAEGLVHRDIKPANILIGSDGIAKVTDFGVVKFISMSNTVSGTIFGSPFYMSPEQLREEEIDGRSELFSLGVVLYECLTGEVPFAGSTIPSITYKILEIDQRPPQSIQPLISDRLAQVVLRALAKLPAERYQSGAEFATALVPPKLNVGSGSYLVEAPLSQLKSEGSGLLDSQRSMLRPGSDTAALSTDGGASGDEPPAEIRSRSLSRRFLERSSWSLVIGTVALVSLVLLLTRSVETERAEVDQGSALRVTPSAEEVQLDFPESPPEPPDPGLGILTPGRAMSTMSSLNIRYNNRLRDVAMSVRLNDRIMWSEDISAPKNVFKRLAGTDVRTTLQIPEGEQTIEVQLRRSGGKPDLSSKITAVFEPGQDHVLKVRYIPPRQLRLSLNTEPDE